VGGSWMLGERPPSAIRDQIAAFRGARA
jgi:hypothetical protein